MVKSIFHAIEEIDSKSATLLKQGFHQGSFPINLSGFSAFLEKSLKKEFKEEFKIADSAINWQSIINYS